MFSKMKPPNSFRYLSDIFHFLWNTLIGYELLLFAVILPIRYWFLGNFVDCVMDGLQNVTQLKDERYLNKVRNYCGLFAVPPNYVKVDRFDGDLFVRVEPRNQTFIESMDFFLAKEDEFFFFRLACINLAGMFLLTVSLLKD